MESHSRRVWLSVLVAFLAVCGLSSALAVTLSPGQEGPAEQVLLPPPPPPPSNVVERLISNVVVLAPSHYRGLAVFPLRLGRVEDNTDYVSLDEASARDWLEVAEKHNASVPELFVSNNSKRHIFMLAGEMLSGGKQNRTLKTDILLLPRAQNIPVPVYCVEQGRWTGKSRHFGSAGRLAGNALRQQIAQRAGQSDIWKQVTEDAAVNSVRATGGNLLDIYQDRKVQERMQEFVERFHKRLPDDIVGLVLVEHNHIVACDIFCNPALFEKLRKKILSSYVVHPLRPASVYKILDRKDVREFLNRVYRARLQEEPSPGGGRRIQITGGGITGNGLTYRQSVIHVALFPCYVTIKPEPRPIIRRGNQQR